MLIISLIMHNPDMLIVEMDYTRKQTSESTENSLLNSVILKPLAVMNGPLHPLAVDFLLWLTSCWSQEVGPRDFFVRLC